MYKDHNIIMKAVEFAVMFSHSVLQCSAAFTIHSLHLGSSSKAPSTSMAVHFSRT